MFIVILFWLSALLSCLFPVYGKGFGVYALPRPHRNIALHSVVRRASPQAAQIAAFLDAHNAVRALHNATALTWSPSFASKAESWADACQLQPTNGILSNQPYGEHIVAGTGDFAIPAAVATFVADKDQYDPANPSYLHFTQVVWKSTTEIGCAVSQCPGLFNNGNTTTVDNSTTVDNTTEPAEPPQVQTANLYVCLYNPAGNVIGQAPENVQL